MENLKVIESAQAYVEQTTAEGQRLVLNIVLPQMNEQERVEFYEKCIEFRDVQIESLALKITRSMRKVSQMLMIADQKYKSISRATVTILLLFICLSGFSQNFKSVAKFGMTKEQIADTCAKVAWCRMSNDYKGEPVDGYTGLDFPVVMFAYKADKCYKVMLKNSTPITFDKPYKVITGRENGMFVYTVER